MNGSRHGRLQPQARGNCTRQSSWRTGARHTSRTTFKRAQEPSYFTGAVTAPVSAGIGPPINGRICPAIPSVARTHSPVARVEPEGEATKHGAEDRRRLSQNSHFQLISRCTNSIFMRVSFITMSGQLASFPTRLAPNSCRAVQKPLWHRDNLNHAHCKIEFDARPFARLLSGARDACAF
jgi:hypothetical protein